MYAAEDTVPVVESLPAKAASAVPKRLLETLELKDDPEPVFCRQGNSNWLNAEPHYNMRYLTGDALLEAETRSRKIQRTARIRNLDPVKIVSLKLHEGLGQW